MSLLSTESYIWLCITVIEIRFVGFSDIIPRFTSVALIWDVKVVSLTENRTTFFMIHYRFILLIFVNLKELNLVILNCKQKRNCLFVLVVSIEFIFRPGTRSIPSKDSVFSRLNNYNSVSPALANGMKRSCTKFIFWAPKNSFKGQPSFIFIFRKNMFN